MEARFVYVFILGILFSGTKDLLRSQIITADSKLKSKGLWEIYSGLVLLVSLLFRAHNLPVLCCCLLIQTLMAQFIWKKLHYDAAQTTIMHYWFGQAFFYFQVSSSFASSCKYHLCPPYTCKTGTLTNVKVVNIFIMQEKYKK